MSDIAPGDVVMVFRWPHAHMPAGCAPGSVSAVEELQDRTKCPVCGRVWREPAACLSYGGAVPLAWLTKLSSAGGRPAYVRDEAPLAQASAGGVVWTGSA